MICISIGREEQLAAVLDAGADLIELRLDLMGREVAALYSRIPKEVRTVVTCRPGGLSDEERSKLLLEAMERGASYVDLELDAPAAYLDPLLEKASAHGCEVIISHHDFERTPEKEDLVRLLKQCYERGAAVAKIAAAASGREDVLNLISLYGLPGRKVVLGMGESGRITRVLAPYLGAEFTFASLGSGQETAPGQLDLDQLKSIYQSIGAP